MIPDLPTDPRQALEASLTALLLGELPPDQVEFLQRTVAQDPELAKQFERLKRTIELVRETGVSSAKEPAIVPVAPKLSDERRQELLQHFKTVAPKAFSRPRWRETNWLMPTAVAACIVALLGVMLLPGLTRSKSRGIHLTSSVELAQNKRDEIDREQLRRFKPDGAPIERSVQRTAPQVISPTATAGAASAQTTTIVLPTEHAPDVRSPSESNQEANGNLNTFYRLTTEGASTGGLPWSVSAGNYGGGGIGGGAGLPTGPGKSSLAGGVDGVEAADRAKLQANLRNSGEPSLPAPTIDPNTGLPIAGLMNSNDSSVTAPALAYETPPLNSSAARGYDARIKGGDLAENVERNLAPKQETQQSAEQTKSPAFGDSPLLGRLFLDGSKDSKQPVTNWYGAGAYGGFSSIPPLAADSPEQLRLEKLAEDALRKSELSASQAPALKSTPSDASPAFMRRYGLISRGEGGVQKEVSAQAEKQDLNELSHEQTNSSVLGDSSAGAFLSAAAAPGQEVPLRLNRMPVPRVAELPAPTSVPSASSNEPQDSGLGMRNSSGSSAFLADGKRLFQRGRLEEAETQLTEATKKDPKNQEAYYYLNLAKEAELKAKLADNNATVKSVALAGLSDTVNQRTALGANNRDDLIAITPPPTATNASPDETLAAGVVNFPGTDLNQVLQIYAELAGRTVLRPATLPPATITFEPQTPLTRREAIKGLDAVLALNGLAVVDTGGKFVKVVPVAQSGQIGAPFNTNAQQDVAPAKPAAPPPIPQPELQVRENAFSTFSLNVSDVSFKLAAASLEKGLLPEAASIRSEEFINAFDYRDPEPVAGVPIAFAWERARYPFAQSRDLLRFSIKTAASGRQAGRLLNVVLLLDNSGSMERADRVAIIHEALRVLATQLQPQDTLSVVTFARTARLWVDGVPGSQAGQVAEQISSLTPQGGTNLEEAMNLAYATAFRHYLANGINRVVLLTDGAANLGDIDPDALKKKAEINRKQGVALDCFGIGWEGYNDDLLEVLARNSDGRYGFINTPEEAATEFAAQLAGALQVAASDVKVQVEFNPGRVTAYRQIGYAKHQLTKEQFRDNTVNAAQIGAAESGNALYLIDCNPGGQGPIATVRVRYRIPATSDYRERQWDVPYTGTAAPLEQASPTVRLAASAGAFAEWLASSPYAAEVTPDALLRYVRGIPEVYGADPRPKKLEWMLRQAKSISGK